MKACFIGSTGVLVETARLERQAYNAAFEELGLDLYWNVATYCKLQQIPGGLQRLESLFEGEWLEGLTDEVFVLQQKHFDRLARTGLELRPAIADVFSFCKRNGIPIGWVTTAAEQRLDTLIAATPGLTRDTFDVIVSGADVASQKPDPAAYIRALELFNVTSADVIAVEDSPTNQAAAFAADLQCYLYPGEYTLVENNVLVTHDLAATIERAHTLWSADVPALQSGGQAPDGHIETTFH